jgi:hypothetical protein
VLSVLLRLTDSDYPNENRFLIMRYLLISETACFVIINYPMDEHDIIKCVFLYLEISIRKHVLSLNVFYL